MLDVSDTLCPWIPVKDDKKSLMPECEEVVNAQYRNADLEQVIDHEKQIRKDRKKKVHEKEKLAKSKSSEQRPPKHNEKNDPRPVHAIGLATDKGFFVVSKEVIAARTVISV